MLTMMVCVALCLSACSAVQRVSDQGPGPRGYLELLIEPPDAEVFIDEQYQGIVAGWVEQIVPVPAGRRMVELRAPGYIAQRFDIEVGVDEQVTLELHMEREFETVDAAPKSANED